MDYEKLFSVLCLVLAIVVIIMAFIIAKHRRKPSDANYLELTEGDVIVIDKQKVIKYQTVGDGLFAVEIRDKEEPESIVVTKGQQRGPVNLS